MGGTSARSTNYGHIVEAMFSEACVWKGISFGRQLRVWRDWAFRAGRGQKWNWYGRTAEQGPKLDLSDCLVAGTLDQILVWNGKAYVVDWKSTHPYKFSYLDKEIDENYARQLAGYHDTFKTQYGATIKWTDPATGETVDIPL